MSTFFEFVEDNQELIVVWLKEMHDRNSAIRRTLTIALEDIAVSGAEKMLGSSLVAKLDSGAILQAMRDIAYYLSYSAAVYIDNPKTRRFYY